MNSVAYVRNGRWLTATMLTLVFFGSVVAVKADDNARLSATKQQTAAQRTGGIPATESVDSYSEAMPTVGPRTSPKRSSATAKPGARPAQAPNTQFWFYSASVDLYHDQDRDGYYYSLAVLFDADTVYSQADVYAVLYLSYEGGPWTEYATTDAFTIFGTSADDEYSVETDLLGGYPRGGYDLLVELYDASSGAFVADFGPDADSALSYLPLEDADSDAPRPTGPPLIIVDGGGGAMGWPMLVVLIALLWFRKITYSGSASADDLCSRGLLAVCINLRPQPARLSK